MYVRLSARTRRGRVPERRGASLLSPASASSLLSEVWEITHKSNDSSVHDSVRYYGRKSCQIDGFFEGAIESVEVISSGMKMSTLIELILLISSLMVAVVGSMRCEKRPEGVTGDPSDPHDYFSMEISANPTEYTPGEQYKITLRAHGEHRIKEFLLLAEHDVSKKPVSEITSFAVGTFHLRNMLTKFSDKCPNAVANTNVIPKGEIEVDWTAPEAGNGCVAFKAIIVESREQWYYEGDALTKRFCEEEQKNGEHQPSVLSHCCACDEAKYEVTFEGLWSRNTHPKDFPSDKWRTRFSDVIGASHTTDYSFWSYGEFASEGLREVAENASTRTLESELKAKSDHIRTIIKARGISYPNVTGKTFAVFRVDNRHHLMSLVSMIFPSPDWFVGVSSLELCLENCSWIESMTLRLYPNDAGTDDGLTYDSPDQPTYPRGVIRKITSDSPNDERSPFYDPQGLPIKPLAKLYLSRQRLYEKTCSANGDLDNGEENCEVTEWSDWSPCSVSCGRGVKYKQRRFKNEGSHHHCRVRLTERANCKGLERHCPEDPNDTDDDPRCQLTEWGEWSSCSVSCGIGTKTRSRRYKNRSAAKRCAAGRENPPKLEENLECLGEAESCDGFIGEEENVDCPNRVWSTWSPCSATCGKGVKVRYRLSLEEGDQQQFLMRQNREQTNNYDEENISTEEGDYARKEDDICEKQNQVEVVECISDEAPSCDEGFGTTTEGAVACSLPKDVGPCKSNVDRWYFDNVSGKCEIFSYSGCQGNNNNFKSLDKCKEICSQYQKELLANRTTQKRQLGVTVSGVLSYNMQVQNDAAVNCATDNPLPLDIESGSSIFEGRLNEIITQEPWGPEVMNCKVSKWSEWSPCNVTGLCGRGFKEKHREIIRPAMNGGKPCPSLFKVKKCRIRCSSTVEEDTVPSHDLYPTWGPPGPPNMQQAYCEMSEWSAWSPCSQSCGPEAVQQRTRKIIRRVSGDGEPCSFRIDQRNCQLLACPLR